MVAILTVMQANQSKVQVSDHELDINVVLLARSAREWLSLSRGKCTVCMYVGIFLHIATYIAYDAKGYILLLYKGSHFCL